MLFEVFQHRHFKGVKCIILRDTEKGYKVRMIQEASGRKKEKVTIRYYHTMDFSLTKGYWDKLPGFLANPKRQEIKEKVLKEKETWLKKWYEENPYPEEFRIKEPQIHSQQVKVHTKKLQEECNAFLLRLKKQRSLDWFDIDPFMFH